MSNRRLISRSRRATTRGVLVWAQLSAAAMAAASLGCSGDGSLPGEESVRKVEAELTLAERQARYAQIRDAAGARGIDHTGFLLAGIAYAETGLCHCWSEATWACQGPNSADCGGGPVIAGSADGPCSAEQGGLGMFQFDAGTFTDTLNKYGDDVLTVAGNTSHALDYAINMVKISAYTTNAETDAKALQWIIDFDINNGTLRDQWIKTVTHYYNGCLPSYSCWSQRYAHYNDSLQTVIDESGMPFWVVAPPDKAPTGYLDHAGCDNLHGWAQDPDTPAQTIDVHLYFDSVPGDANAKTLVVKADKDRDDLCAALGSCNHAWEVQVPRSLMDGAQHTVHAYGINSSGAGSNPELSQSTPQEGSRRSAGAMEPGSRARAGQSRLPKQRAHAQEAGGAAQVRSSLGGLYQGVILTYAGSACLPAIRAPRPAAGVEFGGVCQPDLFIGEAYRGGIGSRDSSRRTCRIGRPSVRTRAAGGLTRSCNLLSTVWIIWRSLHETASFGSHSVCVPVHGHVPMGIVGLRRQR